MSRENKKASGKQWNRSGSGKKFTNSNRSRVPRVFRKRPRIEDKGWLVTVGIESEAQETLPEEKAISYVFAEDIDSATVVDETSSNDSGWLTKMLKEIRSEPEIPPRRVCPETMTLKVASGSDIGCCREKNEDSLYVDEEFGLFIVCDGMGGHLAGEVASQKAIEFTVDFLAEARNRRILPEVTDTDFREVWCDLMVEALEHCCDKVFEYAQSNPELDGMATTITAVMIVDGFAFVGHLGDSRLYLCHGDVAKQLTLDHTLLNDILRAHPDYLESGNDLAALNRFKHVLTRCVGRGNNDFEPDSFSIPLVEDDILLLCSDGLSNYFESESQLSEFLNPEDPRDVVSSLIDFARFGGGSDNISAIIVRIGRNDTSAMCSPTADTVEFDRYSDTQEFIPARTR
jgi:protein phosphatase